MKIRKLKLFTNKLAAEKTFYAETLGFEVIEDHTDSFTIKVGWSHLTFEETQKKHTYHYCFLIPSNKLEQALEWMEKRISIINIENGRKTQRFENWNADSFYFYDASGNIAEFITRPDLRNEINSDFNIFDVICVNEIGMPSHNVEKINNELFQNFGTELWKGDLVRFSTNGSQEGLFLIPNPQIKECWFPTTTMKIKPEPFVVEFENNEHLYKLEYKDGEINMLSAG